jgi:hypothetical protein
MISIKEKIRAFVEEQLLIEETRKERFIRKNKNLTEFQQDELIEHLDRYDYKEDIINREIGWQNFHKATWTDIQPIIELESKSLKKKRVKSLGINGLTKNEDYVVVNGVEYTPNFSTYGKLTGVYMPLNHEASQHIASKYVGGTEGKWCISSNSDSYWEQYTFGTGSASHYADSPSIFMMFIYEETKFAVQICQKYDFIIWDQHDDNHGDADDFIPGIDIRKILKDTKALQEDIREKVGNDRPEPSFEVGNGVYFNHSEYGETYGAIRGMEYDVDEQSWKYDITYRPALSMNDDFVAEVNNKEYTPISNREEIDFDEIDDYAVPGDIVYYDAYGLSDNKGEVIEFSYAYGVKVLDSSGEIVELDVKQINEVNDKEFRWDLDELKESYVEIDTGDYISDGDEGFYVDDIGEYNGEVIYYGDGDDDTVYGVFEHEMGDY